MLDFSLIGVAGGAVFIQAVLGLLVTTRPPTTQYRAWFEVAFIAIGFLGMIAVVWSGARTAETADYIRFRVSRIEEIDVSSGSLLKQQTDMMSAQKALLEEKFMNEEGLLKGLSRGVPVHPSAAPISKAAGAAAPPAPAAQSTEIATDWAKTLTEQIQQQNEKRKAMQDCFNETLPVSTGLFKLQIEAANAQNGWAYNRDGEKLRDQYEEWLGEAKGFLQEHKSMLPNTQQFDSIKDLDMGPTLFVIPSFGENAWRNFDARRKAIESIDQQFVNSNYCQNKSG